MRGYAAKDQEFEVERVMQMMKTFVCHRVSQNPEVTYANYIMLAQQLAVLRATSGGLHGESFRKLIAALGWGPLEGAAKASAGACSKATELEPAGDMQTDVAVIASGATIGPASQSAQTIGSGHQDWQLGVSGQFSFMRGSGHEPAPDEVQAIAQGLEKLLKPAALGVRLEVVWRSFLQEPNWINTARAAQVYHEAQCGAFRVNAFGYGRAFKRANRFGEVRSLQSRKVLARLWYR
jgi:hypothetical protein